MLVSYRALRSDQPRTWWQQQIWTRRLWKRNLQTTYIIVPARNAQSRVSEIDGIEAWVVLSRRKSREIVFRNSRRKRPVSPSPPMADIERVTTLKILGVTITSTLSISSYLRGNQVMCTDTVRHEDSPRTWLEWQSTIHGLQVGRETCLVWICQQTWCATNWRVSVAQQEMWTLSCNQTFRYFKICDTTDEQLFNRILHNKQHLLDYLLPPPSASSQSYNLRRRPHTQLLPQRSADGHLTDSNFIIHMLHKDIYWRYKTHYLHFTRRQTGNIIVYL